MTEQQGGIAWILDGGPAGPFCSRRLFEWTMTLAFVGMGVELFFWPRLVETSLFREMVHVISASHLATIFIVVGFARLVALMANGSMPICGPLSRTLGALVGATVWIEMGTALVRQGAMGDGTTPISVPLFLALSIGEMVSTYRAASDACIRTRAGKAL